MSKKLKVFIAIVLIAAIAFGVYLILGSKTDNTRIRANVYNLNYSITVSNVNVYEKINSTIAEMSSLIDQKGFNVPEVKAYFSYYKEVLDYYKPLQNVILENAVFVNDANTNDYYKRMNEAYKKLKNIYLEGYNYLCGTYFAVTPSSLTSPDYLVSFQDVFKDALKQMNIFNYNAGMAYSYGVRNTYNTNSLHKLRVGYYALLVNAHVEDYLDNNTLDVSYTSQITDQQIKLLQYDTSKYIENKSEYDKLIQTSREINLTELVIRNAKGEYTTYLTEIKKVSKKSKVEKYYELIIKG